MRSVTRFGRLCRAVLVFAALILPGTSAWAQIMDSIEINRVGSDAEITIHFSERVQYLRHGPLKPGKLLRVFIRSETPDSELMQQTLKSPQTDLVPRFTVTFPELSNGMAVAFAQETSWEVRPGIDGRSIIIKVPALPGSKDVLAEIRSVAQAEGEEALEAPTKPATAAPAVTTPAAPAPPPQVVAAPTPATPTPKPIAPTPPVVAAPAPAVAPSPPAVTAPPSTAVAVAPAPADSTSAPVLTGEQVESMARTFLDEARKAIAEKDMARAVNRLNRTLGLPTNSQTEPAQALIGEVREMTGEIAKARAEYELYLKAFPAGPAVPRVKERLAQLPATAPRQSLGKAPRLQVGPAEWTFYGSVSQYLYKGNSHIEVVTPPPPGQLTFTTDTLSLTDQNALISTIDLNARRRDGVNDTRIVVRDTNTQNYLTNATTPNTNRLYSAYIEQSSRSVGYLVRVGRQNPTGGGVLERFDGITAGYNIDGRWRVNAVTGIPVEFMTPYKKSFYGFSLDMQPQPDHVGVSGYYLRQNMDGVVNREAVGLETRYFDTHMTMFGMLDYDIAYKDLNTVMFQGNYRTDAGTNYFTYFDHRKSPALSLTNPTGVLADYFFSVKDALAALGLSQLRDDAKALTATSDMLAVGLTHPYSPRWLLGTDYRASKVSGTDAVGLVPAQPGSGLSHVISVQAIGNSLWTENDVGVVNGSYIIGPNYNGQAAGLNYVFLYGDAWRLDGNLRYYQQKDDAGEKQKRWSPSFKLGFRWKQVTLEGEFGIEDVAIDGPARTERSNRKYFFLGYRWDFR